MKKAIVIAIILIVIGAAIFAAAILSSGNNFASLSGAKGEERTYSLEESFGRIEIAVDTSDVSLTRSEDDKCHVSCLETNRIKHDVEVREGVLYIGVTDERKWYEKIGVLSADLSVAVALPSEKYDALKITADTGDISISDALSFGTIDVIVSTGDVRSGAGVDGLLKIKTSTGDISLKKQKVGQGDLSASTGNISIDGMDCAGVLSITVSTGNALLKEVNCRALVTTGSTGKLELKEVVGSEKIAIERGTGDVRFDACDAAVIQVKTSTGDVIGTLKSPKIFFTDTSTGDVSVPKSLEGGECTISTSTGDIRIQVLGE